MTISAGRKASARDRFEIAETDVIYRSLHKSPGPNSKMFVIDGYIALFGAAGSNKLVVGCHRFEIDAQRSQLAVKMCALHADTFRQLTNFAITQHQLLLQISTLKLLARFP